MTVAFVQGQQNSSTTGTSASITLPSSPTAGNLLIGFIEAASATLPATPTGWTLDGSTTTGGGSGRAAILCHRVVVAGDSATVSSTVPSGRWQAQVHEYSGVDTTTPLQAGTPLCGTNASATVQVTTAITPTAGTDPVIVAFYSARTTTNTANWTSITIGGVAANDRTDATINNSNGTGASYGPSFDLQITGASGTYAASATMPAGNIIQWGIAALSPAAAAGAPNFVPGMGVRRRTIRRALPAMANPADTVLPADPPLPKIYVRRRTRRWPMPRINPGSSVPPPPQAPPVNPDSPKFDVRGLRRFLTPARRARVALVTPAQVAPAAPSWVPGLRVARRLTRNRPRAALSAPLAVQERAPGTTTRRRPHVPPRRLRAAQSTAPQAAPVPVARRLRITARTVRRAGIVEPVPPQRNPPIIATVFGRLRTVGRIQPRPRVSTPTPAQQAAATNPSITATVFGRLRTVGRIQPRPRIVKPIPAQVNPPIVQTVFARLRTVGRIRPRAKVSNPTPAQQAAVANPPITATVFGRLRTVGRIQPRARVNNPTPSQSTLPNVRRVRSVGRVTPRNRQSNPIPVQQFINPNIVQTVFGRLRNVGRIQPRARVNDPTPAQQAAVPNPRITQTMFGRLRLSGRTNRIPRIVKPIPAQVNPPYPVKPSRVVAFRGLSRRRGVPVSAPQVQPTAETRTVPAGGLRGLRRIWLKIRRKNVTPVPGQVTTLQGPLIITDSYGGTEADRNSGTVVGGTYGSTGSSTVSKSSSGGFSADPDNDNVTGTYDSDSDSL